MATRARYPRGLRPRPFDETIHCYALNQRLLGAHEVILSKNQDEMKKDGAWVRMLKSDVKYRFVIDLATLN